MATVDDDDNNSDNEILFVLTGFGPFRGVQENPTTAIADKIMDHLQTTGRETLAASMMKPVVLEVSAKAVRDHIDQLFHELDRQDENELSSSSDNDTTGRTGASPRTIVLIHMGVNYKGKAFQLERIAYNEASFRVPDEQGYQPMKEQINPDRPFGDALETCLDVRRIRESLQDDRFVLSGDAGRFVCNYTYFCSMDTFHCCRPKADATKDRYSLFFHVPPLTVFSLEEQLEGTARLLEAIHEHLRMKRNQ